MDHPRSPSPAYWWYLYSGIVITTVTGVLLLALGNVPGGLVLLGLAAAFGVVVRTYHRRTESG